MNNFDFQALTALFSDIIFFGLIVCILTYTFMPHLKSLIKKYQEKNPMMNRKSNIMPQSFRLPIYVLIAVMVTYILRPNQENKGYPSSNNNAALSTAKQAIYHAKTGEKGFIIFENQKFNFVQLASKTNEEVLGKQIIIYGYFRYFYDAPSVVSWSAQIHLDMYEGEFDDSWFLKSSRVAMSGQSIKIILRPYIEGANGVDELRRIGSKFRETNITNLNESKDGNKMLKISGIIGSDSGRPLIIAEKSEIIR